MHNNKINNILILGAGTMGLQCAISGFEVIIYDAFDQALEGAQTRLQKLAVNLVNKDRLTQKKADAGLLRIRLSSTQISWKASAKAYYH